MTNLHEHLNGIAKRHNAKLVDDDNTKPKFVTPKPTYAMCTSCQNGPILLDGNCEPCYRRLHTQPIDAQLDKLIRQMSVLNMQRVEEEAKLTNAKVAYNKAIKKNHACDRCGKVFSFYGDLFAHEQAKECKPTRTIGLRSVRVIKDTDLI